MKTRYGGRAWLAVALAATAAGMGFAPAAAAHTPARTRAALGPCWLQKLNVGLGEDTGIHDYVTRWRAGAIQTLIQGTAPRARAWSLTLYHERRGKMVSFYDRQITANGRGPFKLAIGGSRPGGGAVWVDPTADGGDSEGYLFYRVYKPSGSGGALPSVTFTSKGAFPAAATSCSALTSDLNAAITRADKLRPLKSNQTVGETASEKKLWPNTTPFRGWSTTVSPAQSVPASNVTAVPLITQLADPNVAYHAVFFNLSTGDLVLHGTLPPISAQAPRRGMRYMSLCAYSTDESVKPLDCLDDGSIKTGAHGDYEIVVSPDQPSDTNNWLNTGSQQVGALLLRWLLPSNGARANFCLPALTYRQPGDSTVPPLPPGC